MSCGKTQLVTLARGYTVKKDEKRKVGGDSCSDGDNNYLILVGNVAMDGSLYGNFRATSYLPKGPLVRAT